MKRRISQNQNTSWQPVSRWYNKLTGIRGGYFHQQVIIPNVIRQLSLKPGDSLLDLGCGQGVLARNIPLDIDYYGIDLAVDLLDYARKSNRNPRCRFLKADITRPLPLDKKDFTQATAILVLQNVARPDLIIKNAAGCLVNQGRLVIVINHPCFRIPRQSSWGIDEQNQVQYRQINRYLSSLRVPINIRPSRGKKGPVAWSFHFSLSALSRFLDENGFLIKKIEEWISDKASVGRAAKMENRAREEFPLFLSILAQKHRQM